MKAAATVYVPVQPGDILAGRYRVERVIGSGGMGVVLAARHAELGHLVAVKVLLPELVDRPEVVERFLREARAVVQLRSEHAVRVLDVGVHEPRGAPAGAPPIPYMVMEYLDGVSLFGLLGRGPIPVADAASHIAQACEALEEAHRLGIVHRDLKPDNLFVTRKASGAPLVKVLDFGISLVPEGEGASRLTGQADVMGTPLYMAPEQMMSARNADARSDVWALGATLYELLTGRAAFAGATVTEICTRVLTGAPAAPSALRAEIPPELSAVVMRCLEKGPERRFQSAAELGRALGPFLPGGAAWGRPRLSMAAQDEPTGLYTPPARSPRLSDPGAEARLSQPTPMVPVVAPATTAGLATSIDARRTSLRWGLLSFGAGTVAIACVVLLLALARRGGAGSAESESAPPATVSVTPGAADVALGAGTVTVSPGAADVAPGAGTVTVSPGAAGAGAGAVGPGVAGAGTGAVVPEPGSSGVPAVALPPGSVPSPSGKPGSAQAPSAASVSSTARPQGTVPVKRPSSPFKDHR